MVRKIIHIDMDAFYASVEQRDNPTLRGRPVVVGGDPHGRGVVAACSYEARRFGIHSAMSCARAARLCPEAVFVRPRRERYQEISARIMAIFHEYTDLVEPLSLDEAFLDITCNRKNIPSATWVAEAIRRDIVARTGLTASAGVSCNKFLAKVASDCNKPDGITVVTPEQALPFIRSLDIGKFYGVGRVTKKKMHALGIRTGDDLRRLSRDELVAHFGKSGLFFHDIVRGIDPRPVCPVRERKSLGTETTLKTDTGDSDLMLELLAEQARQVAAALQEKKCMGRTITLKLRYHDFTTITRSRTLGQPTDLAEEILPVIQILLKATDAGRQKVRLLGITVSNLVSSENGAPRGRQLVLPFCGPIEKKKPGSSSSSASWIQ